MEKFDLWQDGKSEVLIEYYLPLQKSTDAAVVILPGGGYRMLADHEGLGYAQMLNVFGVTAFVVKYRVYPNHFPLPLSDARRAIRFVRSKAEEFGLDKNKILIMGSSAGGHLAALLCTYQKDIGEPRDMLFNESFLPNGQILCYPVISSDERISHIGSYKSLLGSEYEKRNEYSPDLLVHDSTPRAFIWHTSSDQGVNCMNSYRYAEALAKKNIPCEMHIFPEGVHGLGVAPQLPHVAQWTRLLENWLKKYY